MKYHHRVPLSQPHSRPFPILINSRAAFTCSGVILGELGAASFVI
jgi:hypothetical protein